jgi:hypothetical protein
VLTLGQEFPHIGPAGQSLELEPAAAELATAPWPAIPADLDALTETEIEQAGARPELIANRYV